VRRALIAIFCSATFLSGPAFAQDINSILNLLRREIQRGVTNAAHSEWQKLPPAQYSCVDQILHEQGASAVALANNGILPADPRLAQIQQNCRAQIAQGQTPPTPQTSPLYVVDGLQLGGQVVFGSGAYKEYQCSPSDKFPGFTWCHKEKTQRTNGTAVLTSNSIMHDANGTAIYINRYIEPANFPADAVQNEIDRLSARFGERPRILQMPERLGLPHGVIALWGAVKLDQISAEDVSK
jgi:hypothetical protein